MSEVEGGLVRRIETSGSPIYLQYDPGVPDFWLKIISDTLPLAQAHLGDSGPLIMHTYSTADYFVPAYANWSHQTADSIRARLDSIRSQGARGNIWQYLPNHLMPTANSPIPPIGGAGPSPPVNLFHEYFHTVQGWIIPIGTSTSPTWLIEGGADYFAYNLGADLGLLNAAPPGWPTAILNFDLRRTHAVNSSRQLASVKEQFEVNTAALGPRNPATGFATDIGFLATEYLAKTYGVDKMKHEFYANMFVDWKQALSDTFGIPLDKFYSDFDNYRSAL